MRCFACCFGDLWVGQNHFVQSPLNSSKISRTRDKICALSSPIVLPNNGRKRIGASYFLCASLLKNESIWSDRYQLRCPECSFQASFQSKSEVFSSASRLMYPDSPCHRQCSSAKHTTSPIYPMLSLYLPNSRVGIAFLMGEGPLRDA